jgi:hypothetical protein
MPSHRPYTITISTTTITVTDNSSNRISLDNIGFIIEVQSSSSCFPGSGRVCYNKHVQGLGICKLHLVEKVKGYMLAHGHYVPHDGKALSNWKVLRHA